MQRFLTAILALTLLVPAPAFGLRPRAGRELRATTASLEIDLEERSSTPATGLEESASDPEARLRTLNARWIGALRQKINATAGDLRGDHVGSEPTIELLDNLAQGRGTTRWLHLHHHRSTTGLLYRLANHRGSPIVPTRVWAESAIAPVFFDLHELTPRTTAGLLRGAVDAIAGESDPSALRRAMRRRPTMVLGRTMGPGAEGHLVLLERDSLTRGQRWFHDPETRLTALRLDVPHPRRVILTPTEDILARLRLYGRQWQHSHRQIDHSHVIAHAVQVFTAAALVRHPWLTRFLTHCAKEMPGHFAVLGDAETVAPFRNVEGLLIATTPAQLVTALSRDDRVASCIASSPTLYVYDNAPSQRTALLNAAETVASTDRPWSVVQLPLRLLAHNRLTKFSAQIVTAAQHLAFDPRGPLYVSQEDRFSAQCLAARLEQWLATPAAGPEENRRAKVRRLVRRAFGNPRRMGERFMLGFDRSALAEHLITGPGSQRFFHFHATPRTENAFGDIGLYFRIRRVGRQFVFSDPWAEPQYLKDRNATFVQLRGGVAPATIRWLTRSATVLVAARGRYLLERAFERAHDRPNMILSLVATGHAKGMTVLVDPGKLRPGDRVWHLNVKGQLVLLLNSQPRMPNSDTLRVPPKEEALAILRSWSSSWRGAHRYLQVIAGTTVQREPWLLKLLQSYPEELIGSLAVLADQHTQDALALPASVLTAKTPRQLAQQLKQRAWRNPEQRGRVAFYTDDPSNATALRKLLNRRWWDVQVFPTRTLERRGLADFIRQIWTSTHWNGTEWRAPRHTDRLKYLTQRLEQWL